MEVPPSAIIAGFSAMGAVIAVMWGVIIADKKRCQANLDAANKRIDLLTDHTIAQQYDICRFAEDRKRRNLEPLELQSTKTEFYQQRVINPAEEI